jgi:trigger factor
MTTVEALEVNVDDKGGLKRELSFQVPVGAVDSALNAAYDRVASSVSLKGFRNGKVPRQVIKSRYGKEVEGDVLQQLVPEYYRQAVTQAEIEPLTSPEFGDMKLKAGEALSVVATMEIKPELTLAPYEGVELESVDQDVSDEDVAVAHKSLQDAMASLEACDADHVAENGDVAVIDFLGKVDDEAFEGGTAQGYSLSLGESRFIPGFEEQVVGHKAGEQFDVNVSFPDDYHSEELKGKDAVFEITLHEIKAKVLPEVNDEFATQVGDFDNLEALNETLREEIKTKRVGDQKQTHRNEVLTKLAEANDCEVPESWIEDEIGTMVDSHRRIAAMQGQELENEEELRAEVRPVAEIQARGRLVVGEIAKAENLQVAEEDFTQEVVRMSQEYQRPPEEIIKLIRSNPAETERLSNYLLRNKVLDLVIEKANITTVSRVRDKA